MLRGPLRDRLVGSGNAGAELDPASESKLRTAESFGFEWQQFRTVRPEWLRNFLAYMAPHGPEHFQGKLVLDAGSGMGRHAYHAAKFGARVVALDIGSAIDVAYRNARAAGEVLAVQADLDDPPLSRGVFDLVYSIGVLHHLPDPARGLRSLVRLARPGGEVRIYVYSDLRENWLKRALLPLTDLARVVTVRLPHRLLYLVSFPIALVLTAIFVLPARVLRRHSLTRRLAAAMPLAAYAEYPFGVCFNDQFDRLGTPIERRYGREQVRVWLEEAGLVDVEVLHHYGWIGHGRVPVDQA